MSFEVSSCVCFLVVSVNNSGIILRHVFLGCLPFLAWRVILCSVKMC